MVFIFVEGPDALGINQQDLEFFTLMLRFQKLCPYPKAFRARVDGRTNTEALPFPRINNHSIEQERLPRAVLASHRNHPHLLLDGRQKHLGLLRN